MLKVKLSPRGKKNQITYRIVVAESRSKINGKFVDNLGFYTPQTKTLKIDKNKLTDWQSKGAQITTGLDKLLNPDKYPDKPKKKKKKDKSKAPVDQPSKEKETKPAKKTKDKPVQKTETKDTKNPETKKVKEKK